MILFVSPIRITLKYIIRFKLRFITMLLLHGICPCTSVSRRYPSSSISGVAYRSNLYSNAQITPVYSKPAVVVPQSTENYLQIPTSEKQNLHSLTYRTAPVQSEQTSDPNIHNYYGNTPSYETHPKRTKRIDSDLKPPSEASVVETGTSSNHASGQMPSDYLHAEHNTGQSYLPEATYGQHDSYGYGPHDYKHHEDHHSEEKELIEVEDKVFSKTVAATKALKVGKLIFTFIMVLVLFLLAGISKLGVSLSPVVLPFALLPIGIIALLLFIPLFLFFVPIVASGLGGGKKRRRRGVEFTRDFDLEMQSYLLTFEYTVSEVLDRLGINERRTSSHWSKQ